MNDEDIIRRPKTVLESHLQNEIKRLADFIMAEVPGEPSESEGAVDTAIRIIKKQTIELKDLRHSKPKFIFK